MASIKAEVKQKFYTTTGKLKEQINPDGSTLFWTFDLSGRPVKQVLANGNYWPTTYLRNLLTGVSQSFASTNTGPSTSVTRSLDAYGRILSEAISVGGNGFNSVSQTWDAAGRRSSLNLSGGLGIGFEHQADGLMTATDGSVFGYANNGLLIGRTNASRAYVVNQRDGVGRILQTTTSAGSTTLLTENLAWLNNGQLSAYTAARADFTDSRAYSYSPLARRVTQEEFNISSSQTMTNTYTIDEGQTGGLGVLTGQSQSGASSGLWTVPSSGGLDGLSRVAQAQDSIISRSAYGVAAGAGSVLATLDGKPLNVQFDGPQGGGQWRLNMDLAPGSHTLAVTAADPSGLFAGGSTNVFASATNAGDTIQNTYDGNGNITQRVWVNSLGQTNRAQTLIWDAFDRLIGVTERDALTNGFNWTAVYDALGRRVRTIDTMVLSNRPVTSLSSSNEASEVDSWYDPQVEFLEVGVAVNGEFTLKVYGPDANGVYGGMQGVGGLEDIVEYGQMMETTFVQDFFGDMLTTAQEGDIVWSPARFSGYGPVPGYQTPALSLDCGLAGALGWRGKRLDETGLIYLGARYYDYVSGRFISHDPVFNSGNPGAFSMCGGDLVNHFDPDGRCLESAWNFSAGTAKGFVQGYSGLYVTSPANQTEYYGQDFGRNGAGALALWLTVDGSANTGTGLGVMAVSGAAEGATAGVATPVAAPAFAGGVVLTLEGAIQTAIGSYGLYNFSQLQPLQQPQNNNSPQQPSSSGPQAAQSQTAASGTPTAQPNPGSVWSLGDTERGVAAENDLAATEYQGWYRIGAENNGKFPLVDFQQGNDLVSLKTVNTTGSSWFEDMENHIDDLATRGATVNGQPANMILDLRVQPGGTAPAQPLVDYGDSVGVTVKVSEYP
jgi:RHS repeat-associated protein